MATQPVEETELDLDSLVAFLREEEENSRDEYIDEERAVAIDFYNGEPFGDEEEGLSQVVTRDVAEVVDYMTVSLLRTMVSGDKVVEFDYPDGDIAEEATAAVTYQFHQGQDGYRFLHDWIKAGLLEKTSTAKCCVEEQPPKRVDIQLPPEGLAMLEDEGAQIIGVEALDELGTMYSVAYLEPQPPTFRDYVVPNEECDIAQDTRDLDDDGVYIGFRTPKTLSQLAEMGFDTDELSEMDDYSDDNGILAEARDSSDRQYWRTGFNRSGANRKVWYREEYARYDLNGDGIAELLLIHRVGTKILQWADRETAYGNYAIQEIDEQPGVIWCPFPAAHRLIGQSLADKVMDIQRTNSVVLRQILNGFYFANNPRTYVNENAIGDNTIDDLLTVRPGGIVRWQGAIKPETNPGSFDMGSGLSLMEKLAGEKESRTGITRLNQGLDADALNKTATGTALMQAQGQQIEEYLARNFAEAFARLMLKKYRLMRQFGQPMTLSIDGETRQVDPRQWPDDMKVCVRVGLGSGRKDQRLQYRTMVLGIMQAAAKGGSRIVDDNGIYNMVKGVIADANLGSVRDYLVDPSQLPPEEEQPDPKMVEAQAKAMIEAEKVKLDQEKTQGEMMLKARQLEIERELKQQALDYDLQAKREKAALDEQLERDRAEFEATQALQQAEREWQLALMKIEQERELAAARNAQEAELKNFRPGGELDE
jgi:hypothetical protein